MQTLRTLILSLAILLTLALPALAQFENSEVTGFVLDPKSQAIANATITLTLQASGIAQRTTTNPSGAFLFVAQRVGLYTVSVTAPGFRGWTRTGLQLSVAQRARLDITLELGEVSQTVTISDQATTMVETETAGRGQLVTGKTIRELPLVDRDYQRLALLSPGVVPGTGLSGAVNVNGNRWQNNNWLLDGVDNNVVANNTRGGTTFSQPPVDAIEEFRLQTSAYSAEFGRGGGAVFNAALRSGSNEFHGSGWEFFRDSALNARNFFSQRDLLPFRQHQFGGTFGGPIRKNKLFFFSDYEGLRSDQTDVRLANVPNTARFIRDGNRLTGFDFTGRPAIFHPITRDPLPARLTLANGLDQRALNLLALFPTPNRGGNPDAAQNYEFNPVLNRKDNRFDIRTDYAISERHRLFGRYSYQASTDRNAGNLPGLAEGGTGSGNANFERQSDQFATGWTAVLGAPSVNEFRFGWSAVKDARLPLNADSAPASDLTGIRNLPASTLINGGLPNFRITNLTPLGRADFANQYQSPYVYTFKDTFSFIRKTHSIKLGGELRRTNNEFFDIRSLLGAFIFNGQRTRNTANAANTGDPVADFLYFTPFNATLSVPGVFQHGQVFSYGFIQDDWKPTRRLTLNLGVRYEFAQPLAETENRYANFDPSARSGRGGIRLATSADRRLVEWGTRPWNPRLGLAYQITPTIVFRAGYGIFANMEDRHGSESVLSGNPPFAADGNYAFNTTPSVRTVDEVVTFLNGSLNALPASEQALSEAGPSFWGGILLRTQQAQQKVPYTQQWNGTLQWEPAANWLFEAGYVGNKGTSLSAFRNLNPQRISGRNDSRPFPDYGDIQWRETRAHSIYHALQTRINRRFSSSAALTTSYTWARLISNSPGFLARGSSYAQNSFFWGPERGVDANDLQHNWVTSFTYEVPGVRSLAFKPLSYTLRDWQWSGLLTLRGGFPLNISTNAANTVALGAIRDARPDALGPNPRLSNSERTLDRWFRTDAFARPAGVHGSCPVNCGSIRGPGYYGLDLMLARRFKITERFQVQFRAESFNITNTPQFNNPVSAFGDPAFGRVTSSYGERQIQLAIKTQF
jgi:hypothetical protein